MDFCGMMSTQWFKLLHSALAALIGNELRKINWLSLDGGYIYDVSNGRGQDVIWRLYFSMWLAIDWYIVGRCLVLAPSGWRNGS